jgi:RNA recognition motif-containing protein
MTLFIAGLPNDFDDVDFKEMFELYGDVKSSRLITDRATGKSKGYGFIEMPDKNEAQETILALDGVSIKGKKISVKEAEEQQPKTGGFNRNNPGNNNKGGFNRRY